MSLPPCTTGGASTTLVREFGFFLPPCQTGNMRRTDLQDTSLWAHRALIERMRKMTPEEKFRIMFDRIETSRQMQRLAEARRARS